MLNKFSWSAPKEIYREQYGEYAYWCLGVYNTGSKGWELIWHRAIPALDKMCLCFFFFLIIIGVLFVIDRCHTALMRSWTYANHSVRFFFRQAVVVLLRENWARLTILLRYRPSDKIERQFISILRFLNKVHYGFEQVHFHSVTLSLGYRIRN